MLLTEKPCCSYAGTGKRIVFLPYGPQWRAHRAAIHREMTPPKVESYTLIQTLEARLLIHRLHCSPSLFMAHIKQYAGSVILKSISTSSGERGWLLTDAFIVAYGLDSDQLRTQKAVFLLVFQHGLILDS